MSNWLYDIIYAYAVPIYTHCPNYLISLSDGSSVMLDV